MDSYRVKITITGGFIMGMKLAGSIQARVDNGEELLPLSRIKLLAHVDPSTRGRWAASGKLPTVRLGRQYFSTAAAIAEWVSENSERPATSD